MLPVGIRRPCYRVLHYGRMRVVKSDSHSHRLENALLFPVSVADRIAQIKRASCSIVSGGKDKKDGVPPRILDYGFVARQLCGKRLYHLLDEGLNLLRFQFRESGYI